MNTTSEAAIKSFPVKPVCNFSYPGTWGHECGKKATKVFVFKSDTTGDGLYFGARCEECSKIRNGENVGVIRIEEFSGQANQFR